MRKQQFEHKNYDELPKITNKEELNKIQISDDDDNPEEKKANANAKQSLPQQQDLSDDDEDEEEGDSKENNEQNNSQDGSDLEQNSKGLQNVHNEDPLGDDKPPQDQQQQPKNTNIVITSLDSLKIQNMIEFLLKPLPKGITVQCTIQRDKSGMSRFHPKYHLYFSHGFKYLMSGRKRSFQKTSNYLIAADKQNMNKKSGFFMGKVRSNFLGTEFVLYDTGNNPKKSKGGIE